MNPIQSETTTLGGPEQKRGPGRPRGLSRATLEARAFALKFVESEVYRESVWRRIRNDTLSSSVECLMLFYAYGKPKDRIHLEVSDNQKDYSAMSQEEILAELEKLQTRLRTEYVWRTPPLSDIDSLPAPLPAPEKVDA